MRGLGDNLVVLPSVQHRLLRNAGTWSRLQAQLYVPDEIYSFSININFHRNFAHRTFCSGF
jgi:hypothetical protein